MRKDIPLRENEIRSWIADNLPKAYMCRKLKCKPETLKGHLEKLGISYKGNMGRRGKKRIASRTSAMYYLTSQAPIKSNTLKNKLIDDGIKMRLCEKCKLSKWFDKDMPLELHHKNGNHNDNNINNLEILCPNCHALEDNNSGKSIGKSVYMDVIEFKDIIYQLKLF